MIYDTNNIFAKILRGDVPCKKAYEDDHVLAFHDIHPQAPIHILVLPKGSYISMTDFCHKASDAEITALYRAVGTLIAEFQLDIKGYRTITNSGEYGGQEVPHLHIHLLGGRPLGRMLEKHEI